MPTVNTTKWGYVRVLNQSSHAAARGASSGTATANPSTDTSPAFAYQAVSSGRGTTYSIWRAFYYFDTSGITTTVTAASVNVEGFNSSGGRNILVPSQAFGSGALVGSDFGKVTFNTNYHSANTSWNTSSNNVFTLNSTALSDIQNNSTFVCAILQKDNDYDDVALGGRGGSFDFGIAYTTTAYLDYTLAASGPTNVAEVNGIAVASISTWDSNTWANINAVDGIT